VSPLLHNRPERIAAVVEQEVRRLRPHYASVAVGYADCGTYGALDEVCQILGVRRLPGTSCYELFAGVEPLRSLLEDVPGTYVLTDFLVRSFRRTVTQELGLDRFPELRTNYFGNYERVVWLAQRPTDDLRTAAREAAATLGLPLEVRAVGDVRLEQALAELLPDSVPPK